MTTLSLSTIFKAAEFLERVASSVPVKNLTDPHSKTEQEKIRQSLIQSLEDSDLKKGEHNLRVAREQADFMCKQEDRGASREVALDAAKVIYEPAILSTWEVSADKKLGMMKRLLESGCSFKTIACCGIGLASAGLVGYAYGRYTSSNERSGSDLLQKPIMDYTDLLEHKEEKDPFECVASHNYNVP